MSENDGPLGQVITWLGGREWKVYRIGVAHLAYVVRGMRDMSALYLYEGQDDEMIAEIEELMRQ